VVAVAEDFVVATEEDVVELLMQPSSTEVMTSKIIIEPTIIFFSIVPSFLLKYFYSL